MNGITTNTSMGTRRKRSAEVRVSCARSRLQTQVEGQRERDNGAHAASEWRRVSSPARPAVQSCPQFCGAPADAADCSISCWLAVRVQPMAAEQAGYKREPTQLMMGSPPGWGCIKAGTQVHVGDHPQPPPTACRWLSPAQLNAP
jgi:hypothetical protein